MFFISNITWYNKIEEIRNSTKNKWKPTEILVLTDGYTFSSSGLLAKYLKRSGWAIIASYIGNPYKPDKPFDIGQSPSVLFNRKNVQTFSSESFENYIMKNMILEVPGIQYFFDDENSTIPLEYDIDLPDEKTNLYQKLTGDTYNIFVNESKKFLKNTKLNAIQIIKNWLNIQKNVIKYLVIIILMEDTNVVVMENGVLNVLFQIVILVII